MDEWTNSNIFDPSKLNGKNLRSFCGRAPRLSNLKICAVKPELENKGGNTIPHTEDASVNKIYFSNSKQNQHKNSRGSNGKRRAYVGSASKRHVNYILNSNSRAECTRIKLNIKKMIEIYPRGVPLDEIEKEYVRVHGVDMNRQLYIPNYKSLTDLIDEIDGLCIKKIGADTNLVCLEGSGHNSDAEVESETPIEKEEEIIESVQKKKISFGYSKLPKILLEELHETLLANGGCIDLVNLESEYKKITHCSLDLEGLQYKNLFKMLDDLPAEFDTFTHNESNFMCLKDRHHVIKVSPSSPETAALQSLLSDAFLQRLQILFTDLFPGGLALNEVLGVYRGMFGALLDDLNPSQYGFNSLFELLEAQKDIVSMVFFAGKMWCFHPTNSDNLSAEYPASSVVVASENYPRLDKATYFPQENSCVEIEVAEIYSPGKLWVMHRGDGTSQSLHLLMDRMFEFYSSDIGSRYQATENDITLRRPMVVLYPQDLSYYRAVILSNEDLYTYKVFLVDYGTVCSAHESNIWLLHRSYFELPAQAIKASLANISPSNNNRNWPRSTSVWFQRQVHEKTMTAFIVSYSASLIEIYLYDCRGDDVINVGEKLVENGLAVLKDPNSGASSPTKAHNLSQVTMSPCTPVTKCVTPSAIQIIRHMETDNADKTPLPNEHQDSKSCSMTQVNGTVENNPDVEKARRQINGFLDKSMMESSVNLRFCDKDVVPVNCEKSVVSENCVKGAGDSVNYEKSVNSEKCGKSVNSENCGKSVNSENCGKSVNSENCGKSGNLENCGKSGNLENCGKSVNSENCGKSTNSDNCGQSLNSENCGKSINSENCGKSINSKNCGKSINSENCGKLINPENCMKSIDPENCMKTIDPENCVKSVNYEKDSEDLPTKDEPNSDVTANSSESNKMALVNQEKTITDNDNKQLLENVAVVYEQQRNFASVNLKLDHPYLTDSSIYPPVRYDDGI